VRYHVSTMEKSSFKKFFIAFSLLLFLVPAVSFADTQTAAPTNDALISSLKAQIMALQTQLLAVLQAQSSASSGNTPPFTITNVTLSTTPIVSISLGQSTDLTNIVQTDKTVGSIRISFSGFKHFQTPNGMPSADPAYQPFGEFLLSYSPCPTSFCTNSTYPSMPAELWLGQSTNFMNETIMMQGIASSSVAVIATPTRN
jgi:hypothetical protein